ncbi:MAG: hypothetical protein ACU837_02975 [Gammaproteobacteria bacterium]
MNRRIHLQYLAPHDRLGVAKAVLCASKTLATPASVNAESDLGWPDLGGGLP